MNLCRGEPVVRFWSGVWWLLSCRKWNSSGFYCDDWQLCHNPAAMCFTYLSNLVSGGDVWAFRNSQRAVFDCFLLHGVFGSVSVWRESTECVCVNECEWEMLRLNVYALQQKTLIDSQELCEEGLQRREYVCACMRACTGVFVCVCVCVLERERERNGEGVGGACALCNKYHCCFFLIDPPAYGPVCV